jgi:hypothetical protein
VFSEENATKLKKYTTELAESIAKAFGLSATVEFTRATKVLVNDASAIQAVEKVTAKLFGAGRYVNPLHQSQVEKTSLLSFMKFLERSFLWELLPRALTRARRQLTIPIKPSLTIRC